MDLSENGLYIIQQGFFQKGKLMNNQIWEFFFWDILNYFSDKGKIKQHRLKFPFEVQGITFRLCHDSSLKLWVTHSMVRVAMVSSHPGAMVSGCWHFGRTGSRWFNFSRQLSNYKIQADQQVREVHLGSIGWPCFLGQGGICLLYLAVCCCDHLLWPLAVFFEKRNIVTSCQCSWTCMD